jgi:hypothetical protein
MTHKKQLWLIEDDVSFAWYLPAETNSGQASEFFFGATFRHGGNLAGLFNWSVDGGEGVDDYLVAVSRAGDLLAYRIEDPSIAAQVALRGQYFIGAVPKGNRFASEQGGNLHLLSVYGLISMNDLLNGVDGKNINADTSTYEIAAIIRFAMEPRRNELSWQLNNIPSQGSLLICSPINQNQRYIQYAYDYTQQGWGLWRSVPMLCFDEWRGVVYFGTADSRVCAMNVNIDNIQINDPPTGTNGTAIPFSILTTYKHLGEPSRFKRGKYIRPQFVAASPPVFTTSFRYDYDLSEVQNTGGSAALGDGLWDDGSNTLGTWNQSNWAEGLGIGQDRVDGGWGIGRSVAVAMSGNSRTDTTLISWDIVWDWGEPL